MAESPIQALTEHLNKIYETNETGIYRREYAGYYRDKNQILFFVKPEDNSSRYYVDLDRIQTAEKQMAFLEHIAGKGFLTDKMLVDFFHCLGVAGLKSDPIW